MRGYTTREDELRAGWDWARRRQEFCEWILVRLGKGEIERLTSDNPNASSLKKLFELKSQTFSYAAREGVTNAEKATNAAAYILIDFCVVYSLIEDKCGKSAR